MDACTGLPSGIFGRSGEGAAVTGWTGGQSRAGARELLEGTDRAPAAWSPAFRESASGTGKGLSGASHGVLRLCPPRWGFSVRALKHSVPLVTRGR